MKKLTLVIASVLLTLFASAQTKYFTRNGRVYFNASSPLEKIDAVNNKASSILDISNGQIEFGILMKAFLFERALMQEHFNENYMESEKFPFATFAGKIEEKIDYSKDGCYKATVTGMMMHGASKKITATGTVTVSGSQIILKSVFKVHIADYNIEVPALYVQTIAEDIEIRVDATLAPYVKS